MALAPAQTGLQGLAAGLDRPFLWAPAAFGAGIGLYFALPDEPNPISMILLSMACVALLFLALRLRNGGGAGAVAAFAVTLAGFGAVAGYIDTGRNAQIMLHGQAGPAMVEGTVQDRADRAGTVRVVLSDLVIDRLEPAETPMRVRITLRDPADPGPGARIAVLAILNGPRGPAIPGAFDFRRYAYFQGLGAVGFAIGQPDILQPANLSGLAGRLETARFDIGNRIARHLPGQSGAVAIALLTGERGRISDETTDALRIAGLAHLLAISGLHVGLVAGLIFFTLRAGMALAPPLALTWPIKKIAAALALAGCLAYVVLVGAPVPTQRAFIMAFVVLAAVMLDRTAISLRTVAFAALTVLLLAPHTLMGPSFQLSFAAVTVLVALYEWLTERSAPPEEGRAFWSRGLRYFGGVLLTTFVVGLATLPFSLFHFSRIAPWSMAANLVGVPLTAFAIMPLGVAAMAAMPLGLEAPFLTAMGWCIDALIWVAAGIAAWPAADLRLPAMPVYGLLLAVLGGLWLCLTHGPWRLAGLPLLAASLATPYLSPAPAILVAEDQSLIALVRPEQKLLSLSTKRSASFVRGIWLDRMGYTRFEGWEDVDANACDAAGCRLMAAGQPVLVPLKPRGLAEDCGTADLLIAGRTGLGLCAGPQVINDMMLSERGSLALYPIEGKGWRIVGTKDRGQNRPWSE